MKIKRFGVPDDRFKHYGQPCECDGDNAYGCGISPSPEQLANALFVKNKTTKKTYLNICVTTVSSINCSDYEPGITCGLPITLESFLQLLANSIELDDCGNPRIRGISFCAEQ
jgi:hypothetical protein